jgi:serine/threonine protein kinase
MNMRRVGTDIGDYRVLTLHAEGKTGALYKARHKLTNRLVAIKILNLKVEEGGPVVQRFLRAAGTGAKLIHNNIAQIYGSGVLEGQPYLVTEFVEGQTLKELVEKGGPLSQRRAADLIGCVAGALFQAHQAGIVHRDVQPANIMIDKEGTPKLIDLGMVKAAGESEAQVTAMGMTVGTPEYMAPEQATGAKDRDHRIDLYSLGATLYFAVTGRPPFTGKTPVEILKKAVLENPPSPSEFNPNLSADFARVILTGMAKKPADRFPTGRQMAATLAQFAVQR